METNVDKLIDGTFKRIPLSLTDNEENLDIIREIMKRQVSFEVRYSQDYTEHSIHLI